MARAKKIVLGLATILTATPSVLLAATAPTTGKDAITSKLKNIAEIGAGYSRASGDSSVALATLIGSIVRIALVASGFIFFALIAYAGYIWMTAGGDDDDIKKATKIITRAGIGLIITILAGAITQFVLFYAQQ